MMINNYVLSLGMLNTMNQHAASMAQHMRRISTGLRINSVADDPAGWAIGQRMDVRIRGLDAASRNAQQSKSLLKVAEGGISSTVDILRTLKEKAIEAASDTATTTDRQTIQKLFDQYTDQIDDDALVTYNGKYLLDGSRAGFSQETAQAFTNRQLSTGTTLSTRLTDLKRRDGSTLNIQSDDTVQVSYVKDGKTYSASYSVKDTTVSDIFSRMNAIHGDVFDVAGMSDSSEIGVDSGGGAVHTVDGEPAISVRARDKGTDGMISGFTIGICDSHGQMKKSANSVLDAFLRVFRPKIHAVTDL